MAGIRLYAQMLSEAQVNEKASIGINCEAENKSAVMQDDRFWHLCGTCSILIGEYLQLPTPKDLPN